MRHIIPISGKDSLATALVQRARRPDLTYEFMHNPTGADLPEVYEWLDRVEKHLGQPIIKVGRNLEELIEFRGFFLPSARSRYCTRESKIGPMEAYINKEECTVYYGIRADEERGGYNNSTTPHITPAYPLKELGITLPMVYAINANANLKPPTFFWKSVYDAVCKRIGEKHIKETLTEWEFDALFSWRSRSNCYFCFNQQYREWVGLLEHYPDLFWKAEAMEHKGSEYTWNQHQKSLKQIAEEAERIKLKWINKLVRVLSGGQTNLFQEDKDSFDILSVTSCGLLCGK